MEDHKEYRKLARQIRAHAVAMTSIKQSGHLGSSLSMADILAVLYGSVLKVEPLDPEREDRDRFVLSKGHGAAGVYAVLAEQGFFPTEWLKEYYTDNGKLSGHISHHIPGVEFSTGSLGHGLPVAAGFAVAAHRGKRKYRIFTLLSDGDCNEGSTWEAIMFAAQEKLDNLITIVDYNRIQALGASEKVINLDPLKEKFRNFHWGVCEIDGHNFIDIEKALSNLPIEPGKPSAIIAHTVKGKGIKSIENTVSCHYRAIPAEKLKEVYRELGVER
jgi:transketolase